MSSNIYLYLSISIYAYKNKEHHRQLLKDYTAANNETVSNVKES